MEDQATTSKSMLKTVPRRFSMGELTMRASLAAAAYVLPPTRPYLDALMVSSLRVKALGRPVAVKEWQNMLAMHFLQFRKYWGQTFKWLLENDLGWATGVFAIIEATDQEIPNEANTVNIRLVKDVESVLSNIIHVILLIKSCMCNIVNF